MYGGLGYIGLDSDQIFSTGVTADWDTMGHSELSVSNSCAQEQRITAGRSSNAVVHIGRFLCYTTKASANGLNNFKQLVVFLFEKMREMCTNFKQFGIIKNLNYINPDRWATMELSKMGLQTFPYPWKCHIQTLKDQKPVEVS